MDCCHKVGEFRVQDNSVADRFSRTLYTLLHHMTPKWHIA